MTISLTIAFIALAVPFIAIASGFALRGRTLGLVADKRGVALQTVIVIVVLLAIAGAVAGVLLSRGAEVTADLESQDSGTEIDTDLECTSHFMAGVAGVWDGDDTECTWTAAAAGTNPSDVTRAQCALVRGTYTAGTAGDAATCVV